MVSQLLETSTLTASQLDDARALVDECNRHEALDYLQLNKEMASQGYHFLLYEAEQLVGFLTMFDGPECETQVIVDARYRRRGIARTLINAARDYCKRMQTRQFLLVCEEKSTSGRGFAEAIGAEYRFSEYRMRLEREPQEPPEVAIHLHRADDGDPDLLVRLIAKSFNDTVEVHYDRVKRDIRSRTHRFYIASLAEEPIGCIGIVTPEQRAYVIAFGILPEYRSRGYGRQILTQTLNVLVAESWKEILIEVRTDNRNALELYSSCGFVENTSFRHYAVTS